LFTDSFSYYERSLAICRAFDYKPGLVNNYSYMGIIYTDLGKYEEAIEYFNKALTIQKELNDKSGIAHNLNNVANLYSYLGNYQESLNLLNQALEITRQINDSKEEANTLINLATIDFRLRNYEKSIEYLNNAFKIADEAKEEKLKAYALNLTGVVYRNQGNYDKALDNYQQALKINKKLGLETEISTNLTIIGDLYKEQGSYDEALKYFQQSLNISESLKDRLIIAANLNYIGEVKYKQGHYEESLKLYNSSLETFEELGFKDRVARNFNDIGYLKGDTKQWDSAIENFDKAIAIYQEMGDREWLRVALYGRGLYSEKKGDLVSAEKNYKEAVEVFESIRENVAGGEEAEQTFSDINVEIYERLVSLLIRLGKKEEALEYIERSRSKALRETFLRSGITSYDEKTRGLLSEYDGLSRKEASINYELSKEKGKPSPNVEKIDNLVKTLAKTRKDFSRVTSQLKTEHPDVYKLLSIRPGTFMELEGKETLPGNTVFVEYFLTDKDMYIFLMSEKNLIVKRVSVTKEELNKLVALFIHLVQKNKSIPSNNWLDDGSNKYSENIKPFKDVAVRLYQYLLEPISDEIKKADVVAIIPFGSLHYLPFHALAKERADGGLEFFIQKKRLVYLVSTSTNYLELFK
ncbi:MAG TPA: tetratricopeptide repeat protein, partial [Thermodesulfobacteriota bacterium]